MNYYSLYHWINRRVLGKKQILDFIQEHFLPMIKECEKDLLLVKNLLYRKQIRAIIAHGCIEQSV